MHSLQMKPEKVLSKLKEFELFCLGKKDLSPDKFRKLNKELSLSTVMHVGTRHYRSDTDGKHLIWCTPDMRQHDLGPVNNLDIAQTGPGFHKTRTLALGADQVIEHDLINTDQSGEHATIVKMKDGTIGVGPNYKVALRNAALKMHLKGAFERANKQDIWKQYYGSC